MLTIENIKKIEGTLWTFGTNNLIKCIKAEEVNDTLILNKNSYTFDFDINLGNVPLVIWFDRHKDLDNDGYRLENNLVEGARYIQIKDLVTFKKFTYTIEDYLHSIEPEIKKNFFK